MLGVSEIDLILLEFGEQLLFAQKRMDGEGGNHVLEGIAAAPLLQVDENAPGKGAYPISSFTYLLIAQTQTNAEKGKKLIDFIKWALHDGETMAASLDYAPLPTNVVAMLDKRLAAVKLVAAK